MKRSKVLIAVCACILLGGLLISRAYAEFQAGAATVDITAPVGTPLAGYGDRWGRPSTGVHDPVYARALFLSDGETPVVIVTSDLIGISKEFRDKVVSILPDNLGVPRDNIVLCATHTHSSQGAMTNVPLIKIATGRYDESVYETTARKFAGVIANAVAGKAPATIGYGIGEDERLSVNRARRAGPTDPVITVIRVDDKRGKPIAILGNFAAHPTVLDSDNMLFSGDYPGYFVRHLEQLCGGSVVAMFANGTQGDQGPANPEGNGGFARAESLGKLLAQDVKGIADRIKTTDRFALHVGYSEPQLPPSVFSRVLNHPTTALQTIEINDLLLITVPGEMCVDIGSNLKRKARELGYAHAAIVGLANDHLGYFVPRSYYDELHYETAMNFYGPRIEDFFYREILALPSRAKRGVSQQAASEPKPAVNTEKGGIRFVRLEGEPYDIGYKHGDALRDSIRHIVEGLLFEEPARHPELLLPASTAKRIPRFLNIAPLYVPFVAIRVRTMNRYVDERFRLEMEGMADGAGVSYDELFLANVFFTVTAQAKKGEVARLPMCTNVAAFGPATRSGELVIGRDFDLDVKRPFEGGTTVLEYKPTNGFRCISVGWAGSVGVFSAMNERGLVLAVESVEGGENTLDGVPINLLLRKVIQDAGSLNDAIRMIREAPSTGAYNVLVGDANTGDARVIEVRRGQSSVRVARDGLVFGQEPGAAGAGVRYERARELIQKAGGKVDVQLAQDVLKDRAGEGSGSIWNSATVHSVVFEPSAGKVFVAQADKAGAPGTYMEFAMEMNLETKAH